MPIAPVQLPTSGASIHAIGERFGANAADGTGGLSIPLPLSTARLTPDLVLGYDSSAGNGPFGLGWALSPGAVVRRTDRGVPRYRDAEGSDTFRLEGGDDLVPTCVDGVPVVDRTSVTGYVCERYRPRVEGAFARIERWTRLSDGDVHWRTISADDVLAIFGADPTSRVQDPDDGTRVFRWLLSEVRDSRGNAVRYTYVAEDGGDVEVDAPHERHRGPSDDRRRGAQRLLKHVHYGNTQSLLDAQGRRPAVVPADRLASAGWLFQVVLDYGEHAEDDPGPDDDGTWWCRRDPFSTHRPGFEVRTSRLCRRVLVYHHFPDEPDVGANCLVRSLDLVYRADPGDPEGDRRGQATGSVLASATLRGRRADGTIDALPPLALHYAEASPDPVARPLAAADLDGLPAGAQLGTHRWVDLDGSGVAGLLSTEAGAWFYKPGLGGGHLGPAQRLASQPALVGAGRDAPHLVDLDGSGRLAMARFDGAPAGFHRRAEDGWEPFVPFTSIPQLDWDRTDLRLVDLTGDGQVDLLLLDEDAVRWYPSRQAEGFGPVEAVLAPLDEGPGPQVVLADGTRSIFLADLTGDGLADLIRIRSTDISYWPNLGHGRFGPRVTMSGAPLIDDATGFDPSRLRLADLDGSGTADLLHVGSHGIRAWRNQAGNSWGPETWLADLPHLDDHTSVQVADLFGTGAACVVWSSAAPEDQATPFRYVDLVGPTRPGLLVGVENNLGAESTIAYAPAASFALADRRAGRPWATTLPFPLQVVTEVQHRDRVSGTRSTSRFEYHHGCYDPVEREFRGFAMVARTDGEAFEEHLAGIVADDGHQDRTPELHQPPVTTRTWFHTGTRLAGRPLLHPLRDEYHGTEPGLPELEVPPGLDDEELHQCLRALKGVVLRAEVFSFDGSPAADRPYRTNELGYQVRRLQPRSGTDPGVFLAIATESLGRHLDRRPADHRVAHGLHLEVGERGQVLRSASVVYGRSTEDPALPEPVRRAQTQVVLRYEEVIDTEDLDEAGPFPAHRLGVPCEGASWVVTGLRPDDEHFGIAELRAKVAAAPLVDDGEDDGYPAPGVRRRLVGRAVTRFLDDGLQPAAHRRVGRHGLVHRGYVLALTPALLTAGYPAGSVTDDDLVAGGFVHLDGDADWWVPSSTDLHGADPRAEFYRPIGGRDAFGVETLLTRDRYGLLVERVDCPQAAWNRSVAVNDYRSLGPVALIDPNQNRSEVRLDGLGRVVAAAYRGQHGEGDTLDDPTTRVRYQLDEWQAHRRPAVVVVSSRQEHGGSDPVWHELHTYADGSGGAAMVKARVAPGPVTTTAADGTVATVHADPRWVGTGRTIVNNKGNPVLQYEPFFSASSAFEPAEALARVGVSATTTYDPVDRPIRADDPDGTFTRVEHHPWRTTTWDANDTVLDSRWYLERGSPDPTVEAEPADPERRAAWLAAQHAGTPTTTHLDSTGAAVLAETSADGVTTQTRGETDPTGRWSATFDQRDRCIGRASTGFDDRPIWSESAVKGRRWELADVHGTPIRVWDEHGRVFRTRFDHLHRPTTTTVQEGDGPERVVRFAVHGDRHPDAVARNLLGTVHQAYDPAGLVRVPQLDFRGNPERVERVLTRDPLVDPDWGIAAAAADLAGVDAAAATLLDPSETYATSATMDALGRPTSVTLPDGTVTRPTYDEGSHVVALAAQIGGTGPAVALLVEQEHDVHGRRTRSRTGNGVTTTYAYDRLTARLTDLTAMPATGPGRPLQSIHLTYDPVGNVTTLADRAQQTHFFANAVARPDRTFAYDARYQLVRATGREHATAANDAVRDRADLAPVGQLPHVNDSGAVRTYVETYAYDDLGNLVRHRHQAAVGGGSWTRHHRHAHDDDPADATNRLVASSRPGDPDLGPYTATYTYDRAGNMDRLATATSGELTWDVHDQLTRIDLGGGGVAHHVYGAPGHRIRSVVVRPGGLVVERLRLGAVEIYRARRGDAAPHLERRTVHLADDLGRIAQADVLVRDDEGRDPANPLGRPVLRYVLEDPLGSSSIETDEVGGVVSYEEYHPFGTTAYRSSRPGVDHSLKRHRYRGAERDDDTGLLWMGARCYAPWLGRWTSSDPAGFADGLNLYRYCRNNPTMVHDPSGTTSENITLTNKPPEISAAQRDPSPTQGQAYESWLRSQSWTTNGKTYRVSPGTGQLTWTGTAWKLEDAEWHEVLTSGGDGPGAVTPAPPSSSTGTGSGGTASSGSGTATTGAGSAPAAGPTGSVATAAPGTSHASKAATGRAAYRRNNTMPRGTQVQHWTKEISARDTGIHPDVMNQNLSPLQSRRTLPATTLLTSPSGRGTTYTTVGGSTYNTEHKFADNFLIPEIEDQILRANPNADPKDVAIQAGRQARWVMTGDPGPDPARSGGTPAASPSAPAPAAPRSSSPSVRPSGFGGRGLARGAATGLGQTFIPFFSEIESAGAVALPAAVAVGAGSQATAIASAISAAPAEFAFAVTLPAIGGALVGSAAEQLARQAGAGETGSLAAAVLASAAVGAVIGSFIPIPGLGTLAGAAAGAVLGVIGYGIYRYLL